MDQTMGRTVIESKLHKLPSTRKSYRVVLIVPENGIPLIEYYQANKKKPHKTINFADLWFADKKHDTNEKWAFSVYAFDRTITFIAPDEVTMNDWLRKIREYHLYPEITQYDAIFEANLLDKGLGRTMNIQGIYRLALCKESLDLVPLYNAAASSEFTTATVVAATTTTTTTTTSAIANTTSVNSSTLKNPNQIHHHHIPQHVPGSQRFCKRHPWVTQKTIQLARRSIRRCGHSDSNFYIESGRHSTIGEGDLWFALNKKSTARHLHELLLATIRTAAAQADDQFITKAPRSRSGSYQLAEATAAVMTAKAVSKPLPPPEEDSGYLPMA